VLFFSVLDYWTLSSHNLCSLQSVRNECILLFISPSCDQHLFPNDPYFQKCDPFVHERTTPVARIMLLHPLLVAVSIQVEADVHANITDLRYDYIVHVDFAVKSLGSTPVSLLRVDQQ
jgi:hypothetical protein